MSDIFIPANRVEVSVEDATVDLVCFEYALSVLGDRTKAGKLQGYVELVLNANPGLSTLGAVLPRGTVIDVPEYKVADKITRERLWD